LAELIVRTYHESQGKPIYHVRDLKNFGEKLAEAPATGNADREPLTTKF
jgi:hypothetical protein